MKSQNLITKCIDTENELISYADLNMLMYYAQLSKTHNKFINKNNLYKKLQYFYKHRPTDYLEVPWTYRKPIPLIDWCFKNDYIDVLELLKKSSIKFIHYDSKLDDFYQIKNHTYVFRPDMYNDYGIIEASKNGHLNVLQWAEKNNLKMIVSRSVIKWASGNGHVQVLDWWRKYAYEQKVPFVYDEWCMDWASGEGHINVLDWWKNSGLELMYTNWTMDKASMYGYINALNWWKESGLKLKYTRDAMHCASLWNRIEVLNWWVESGLELKYCFGINTYNTEIQNWWNDYLNSKS